MDLMIDDDTGDLSFENGDLVFVDRALAVKQSVRQRLRMFKGEWFLDLDEGTPWFQDILIKDPRPELIEGIIKARIILTPGVEELMSFNTNYDNETRGLSIDFEIRAFNERINFDEFFGSNVVEVQ